MRGKPVALLTILGTTATAFGGLTLRTGDEFAPSPSHGNGVTLTAQPLDHADRGLRTDIAIYSNMDLTPPNYSRSGSDPTAYIATDDYTSTALPGDGSSGLTEMGFVGGVDAVDGILLFDFYDAASQFVARLNVSFPLAGNYIWTIAVGGAATVPNDGYLAIAPAQNTTGTWLLNAAVPTVGTTTPYPWYFNPPLNLKFALSVPEPDSLVLLGFGALAVIRRR